MDYTCKRCGNTYSNKSNLLYHLRKKEVCIVTIEDVTAETLIEDLTKKIPKEKVFSCKYCGKQYSNRQNRWRHMAKCEESVDDNKKMIQEVQTKIDELKKHIFDTPCRDNQYTRNIQTFTENNIIVSWDTLKMFSSENIGECLHDLEALHFKNSSLPDYSDKPGNTMTLSESLNELIQQGICLFESYGKYSKDRIIEDDMTEQDLTELLGKLEELNSMHKKYIVPLSKDIHAMLETIPT